jgi:large subunit ribosomal protein L17
VGDNAETAMIELVDFNEVYGKTAVAKAEPAKKTRRGKKKADGTDAPAAEETKEADNA